MNSASPLDNPYIIGRPIYERECFFGRENIFQFLKDNLNQGARVILLHGQRRIGKSSVLSQIPSNIDSDQFIFIPLSLEGKSRKSLSKILYELALDISDYLIEELDFPEERIQLPKKKSFEVRAEAFSEKFLPMIYSLLEGRKLVLLLDEFDVLDGASKSNPKRKENSTVNRFFSYLSSIVSQKEALSISQSIKGELFVIPVVGRRLDDMTTLLRGMFRGAPTQEIGLLNRNSTQKLITEPAKEILNYNQSAIDEIFDLSSGHPYFTQIICFELFSEARDAQKWDVDGEDVKKVVNKAIETGEGGLTWFRDGLPVPEQVVFSAASTFQDTETGFSLEELSNCLREHGVVETEEIKEAPDNLIEWNFLQVIKTVNFQTRRTRKFKISIELVRLWLQKRHPVRQAVLLLEGLSSEEANDKCALGDYFLEENELSQAIKAYQSAVKINPNHFSALFGLADACQKIGNLEKATELYSRAHKIDPVKNREGLLKSFLSYSRNLMLSSNEISSFQKALDLYVEAYKFDSTRVKDSFSQILLEYKKSSDAFILPSESDQSPLESSVLESSKDIFSRQPHSIEELLSHCTVKIMHEGASSWGTGFFVGPGIILTKAHVVKKEENPDQISIEWLGEYIGTAQVKQIQLDSDLAILSLHKANKSFPSVLLDESSQVFDQLYSFGYSDIYKAGSPVTLVHEGMTGDLMMKLKAGQVRPGMSGAPVLNLRTGKVCGILSYTRDRGTDLGGGATTTSTIFHTFPMLRKLQKEFHQNNDVWTKFLVESSVRPKSFTDDHLIRIYFIWSKQDTISLKGKAEIRRISDFLWEKGFEVIPSIFNENEAVDKSYHHENLRDCDIVLVYYGAENELWLRTKIGEIRQTTTNGRSNPFLSKVIYIAEPLTEEKEQFRTREAIMVRGYGGFSANLLDPLLDQISHTKDTLA